MKAIHLIGKTKLIRNKNQLWMKCKEILGKNKIELHAFIMMNNHFHLLGEGTNQQFQKVVEEIFLLDERFEFFVHKIQNKKEYENVFRYIYQNPKKAKLVENVEEWPYSLIFNAQSVPINKLPYHCQTIDYLKWWLNENEKTKV